jgi:hypothetical protein
VAMGLILVDSDVNKDVIESIKNVTGILEIKSITL